MDEQESRDPHLAIEPLRWASDATLTLPGSKSEANRLLVAAALSGRKVTLSGATPGDDVRYLIQGLRTLGYHAVLFDEARGIVEVGSRSPHAPTGGELFCGNAGTALRFLVSVAAITPGEWKLTGDEAMLRRPIGPLVEAWQRLGVTIGDTNGCPPVRVRGGAVAAAEVTIDASVSSQFASSLLLVGAALPHGLTVRWDRRPVSDAYVTMTARVMARIGIETVATDGAVCVKPGYRAVPEAIEVRGDWSAMGVWTCLGHLTGSRIAATNLAVDSAQADERLAELLAPLAGDGDRTIDVAPVPDQFPNLAVVAAHRHGTTRLVGGTNLRVKECDRIAVMARELQKLGVRTEELSDGLVVHGGRAVGPATIDPANDHRIAMAFALAGLLAPGVTIQNPDCVAKSYPAFWRDLGHVRCDLRCVVVIGMRGAGKSTFAAAMAQATGTSHVDTDRWFEARFQPILPFVTKYGWHNFRDMEAQIVGEAIQPGRIVATGGGAIEHPETQAGLTRAIVLWLDADVTTLRARIAADPRERPSVTGAPVDQEIDALLARRRPLFQRFATHRIDATLPSERQVADALRLLRDSGR